MPELENKVRFVMTSEGKDKVDQDIQQVKGGFEGVSKSAFATRAAVTAAGAAITAAVGAIAAKSVQMASDFSKSMANVSTLVDTNVEDMGAMKQAVLDIGDRTPVALEELTESLYDVRSAGVPAAEQMITLESAAQLAVAGLGTTKEATNLLTSAINAFSDQGYTADEIANSLFATVKSGKTTVSELTQGFGMLAPLASSLGIDFNELMSATAALTTTGMPASQAYTGLKAALSNVLKPTKDATELAANLGIEMDAVSIQTMGLGGRLEHLKEKLSDGNLSAEEQNEALVKLFGSVEGLNTMMALAGPVHGAFNDTLKTMTEEQGLLTAAFEKQTAEFHAQRQLLKNNVNRLYIELGQQILPFVIQGTQYLIDKLQDLRTRRNNLNPTQQKAIKTAGAVAVSVITLTGALAALGGVISMVGTGLAALGVTMTLAVGRPVALAAAVGIAAALIIKHRDTIVGAFDSAAKRVAQKLIDIASRFRNTWNDVTATTTERVGGMVQQFKNFVQETGNKILEFVDNLTGGLATATIQGIKKVNEFRNQVGDIFLGLATSALTRGKNLIGEMISGIWSKAGDLRDAVSSIASDVGDYLGFSSPTKKGPGAKADERMPNLIDMMASGLVQGKQRIARAAGAVASNLQVGGSMTAGIAGATIGGGNIMTGNMSPAYAGPGGGTVSVYVTGNTFYGSDPEFVNTMGEELVKKLKTHVQFESF